MEFRKIRYLGAGTNGCVYLADNPNSELPSRLVAIKSANRSWNSASLKVEKMFLDELVGSPYIVQCLGDSRSVEFGRISYNVVMEYACGGTLTRLIKEREGRIEEREAACYAAMLLQGLGAAHKKGIVHCDLKPDNILVFPRKEVHGAWNHHLVKIADFGNAKKVWEAEMIKAGRASHHRGSLWYAAPESVMYGVHEPAADVWSLGCVILEMLTGQPVWGGSSCEGIIFQLWLTTPQIPEYVSEIARDFLDKCFQRTPHERWTTHKLMRHQFVTQNWRHFSLLFTHHQIRPRTLHTSELRPSTVF